MDTGEQLLGAVLLTYFVSRLTLRLPLPLGRMAGTVLAHALALLAILGAVFAVRAGAGAFVLDQTLIYLSPQVLWCLLDLLREHRLGWNRTATRLGQ